MIYTTSKEPSGLGVLVKSTASGSQLPAQSLSESLAKLESSRQNIDLVSNASSLCRQLGYPRVCIGASGRVRREPSLGDSTPAGAENSQATLYIASAELRTQGIAKDKYPAFAASKSRILGID